MDQNDDREHRIRVSGIFGTRLQEPLVEIGVPVDGVRTADGEHILQIRPDEARDLALNLVCGAEGAESDGFLVDFFTREFGLTHEQLGGLLLKFRGYRTKLDREGT